MDQSELIADTIDNLRRVFQVIQEYSKKVEHATGLTSPQLWAIKVLAEAAPMIVSELARPDVSSPGNHSRGTHPARVSWPDKKDQVEGRSPGCLGGIDLKREKTGGRRPGSGSGLIGHGVGKNTAKRTKGS